MTGLDPETEYTLCINIVGQGVLGCVNGTTLKVGESAQTLTPMFRGESRTLRSESTPEVNVTASGTDFEGKSAYFVLTAEPADPDGLDVSITISGEVAIASG